MDIVCVYNPVSGKGKGGAVAQELSRRLIARGHRTRLVETLSDLDAFRVRCREIHPASRVICIGGDGTLLHFINAQQRFDGLAFWGVGTTNVMSRELGVPRRMDAFIHMIENGRRLAFLPGITNRGRLFLMQYSNGIDAHILSLVSQRAKNRFGRAAFLMPSLKALFSYDYPLFQIGLDEMPPFEASWVVVTRIKRYAGSFIASRDADPTSAHFRVLALQRGGFWSALTFFLGILRGRPERHRHVLSFAAREVRLRLPDNSLAGQVDGDLLNQRVSLVRVSERPISFLVPDPARFDKGISA